MDTRQIGGGNPSLTPRWQTPYSFSLKDRGKAVLVSALSCPLLLSLVPLGTRLLVDPSVHTSVSKRYVRQMEGKAACFCKDEDRAGLMWWQDPNSHAGERRYCGISALPCVVPAISGGLNNICSCVTSTPYGSKGRYKLHCLLADLLVPLELPPAFHSVCSCCHCCPCWRNTRDKEKRAWGEQEVMA